MSGSDPTSNASFRVYDGRYQARYQACMIMQSVEDANEMECRKGGLDIAQFKLFRITQVFYTLLSLSSLPLLLYVQVKYIFNSTFHKNMKIYGIAKSIVSKPCDFFPSRYTYAFQHMALVISNHGMIFTMAAMSCERSIATVRSNKYESKGIALGVFLVVLVICAAFASICYVYKIDNFDVKLISTFLVPPSAITRYNHVTMLNFTICVSCVVMFHASSRISRKQSSA
ncbi:hypothetical protein KIN20_009951, partial [Parelaphostrongylus tenuis]